MADIDDLRVTSAIKSDGEIHSLHHLTIFAAVVVRNKNVEIRQQIYKSKYTIQNFVSYQRLLEQLREVKRSNYFWMCHLTDKSAEQNSVLVFYLATRSKRNTSKNTI